MAKEYGFKVVWGNLSLLLFRNVLSLTSGAVLPHLRDGVISHELGHFHDAR